MKRSLTLKANAAERVKDFLNAYRAADDDADIDVRIGTVEDGSPAVVISINGAFHGFTSDEARRIALIAEEGMRACPDDPESASLPNLIMALRMGADEADAASTRPGSEG